jgi:endonuclease/exonuclease/phosphatase family metal-dependent hydrolase
MKIRIKSALFTLLFLPLFAFSQPGNSTYLVMFYNVENLFDTFDEPGKNDEEFLPDEMRHWIPYRYNQKLTRISQVIMAAGKGNLPVVAGLCEIENRLVLEELLSHTPLGKMGYKIIHKESPDRRGIDVGMLYRADFFKPLSYTAIPVSNPSDTTFYTRDILHVTGIIKTDTLNVFVNHWPSKYGGVAETIPLRALAAQTLKNYTDSLMQNNANCKIVIMGDFNDSPFDASLANVLGALAPETPIKNTSLYNLSLEEAKKGTGTNKYRGKWEMIDQIIVNGTLLIGKGLQVTNHGFKVYSPGFLLEKDKTYTGQKPFRTYIGFKYNNGFSDHLPVLLELGHK